jgi:hypothetical protein
MAGPTLGERDATDFARTCEGDGVEELQRSVDLSVTGISQLVHFDLVHQKGADLGGTELLRAAHEEGSELAAVQQVIAGGGGTDSSKLQVLFHPVAELSHGGSPW